MSNGQQFLVEIRDTTNTRGKANLGLEVVGVTRWEFSFMEVTLDATGLDHADEELAITNLKTLFANARQRHKQQNTRPR